MGGLFGKPIVTQEEMRTRIAELGQQITHDYRQKDLVLIGILKGSFAFYADLARAITLPLCVDFLVVSRYAGKTKSKGRVKILTELTEDITGRDVLLIEDIVDSGRTLRHLREMLGKRKPQSIKVCTLLNKARCSNKAMKTCTSPNRSVVSSLEDVLLSILISGGSDG